ncbi:hypothetical protein C0989_012702 [Termitomyces sp. Mn162]|nr:hypothetical protein C0989_012702 [Termitomyces sp. Mn162]
MNTDTDASIRQTDTDALLARLSAVEKGYIADPYVRRFVPARGRWEPRGPLMNVGTYVRGRAVDGLVEGWFEGAAREGRRVQVVSMGAGSDTRFWRVAVSVEDDDDDDAAQHTHLDWGNGGTTVHGEKYHLLAADLRLGPETTLGRLLEPILDWSVATLLLFECVLVYMEPGASDGILRWFAGHVEGPLGGIVYEMFGLEDAFGKVMVENLKVGAGWMDEAG